MDSEVDHYKVLGLPSGEEGAKLTDEEIKKAYRSKALQVHPDKKRDDPDAQEKFQKLTSSYEILKDEKARKLFDDLLRVKREKQVRESHYESKRRKMVSELEKRERSAYDFESEDKPRGEEERIKKKLQEEIARIRAMHAKNGSSAYSEVKNDNTGKRKESVGTAGRAELDKEKVLNVSWEKVGGDYSAERLREIFGKFGEVEDVVIMSSKKKKGKAIVVMKNKEAVVSVVSALGFFFNILVDCRKFSDCFDCLFLYVQVAASGCVSGDLSNPLLVVPLVRATTETFSSFSKPVESNGHENNNLVGAGHQAFESSVLEKLLKVRSSI
jgi:DnaJ homolog subfamily C member 17